MGHMAHPSEPSTRTVKAGNPWAVTDRGGHDHEKEGLCDSHPLHQSLCRGCPGGLWRKRRRYRQWRCFIPVFDPDKNADELFDYEAKWNASFEWTENDPVKYNGKTWRNASYTHSGGVTTEYFTDVDGGSVYVRIDNVEEHKDAVETMMKSLEFADDIAEAKTEAMDVKLDDIEIKR